jgi:hypothetical protein
MGMIRRGGICFALAVVALTTAGGQPALSVEFKCEANKLTAAGKYDFCRLKAEADAVKTQSMPDFSRCDAAYSTKWGKAETQVGVMCPSSGDIAAVQEFITEHTDALRSALDGGNHLPSLTCGNGTVDPGEQCDLHALNGQTCALQGFAGGTLACAPGCVFDTSGCWSTRYVDNGNGTVTDRQTRLVWEKKDTVCPGPHCYMDGFTWSSTPPYPNGTAFTVFLYGLNAGSSGYGFATSGCFTNHCDWRLPTIEELNGVLGATQGVCNGSPDPCIDPIFGPSASLGYWSATGDGPNSAWQAYFFDNSIRGTAEDKTHFFYARAVRAGP